MIETAQPGSLVAAKSKRGAAMRACLRQGAEAALGVAEHDHVLAHHTRADWRAVGLTNLFGHTGGQPMTAHQLAHWRVALDPAEDIVFFARKHASSLGFAFT